jgi:lipoate-protein ligase A
MNQRIHELYIKTLSEECSNPALVDIEKFAELIVRECAELFDKDEIELTLTERTIHSMIKEHFGVE